MAADVRWTACRLAFLETARTLDVLLGDRDPVDRFRRDWQAVRIVEVDESLIEQAVELALGHGLRSLDALHLAAALVADPGDLTLATWDRRLWAAGASLGLGLLPDEL
jgi:predicted nucleic acid-binding protein